MGITHLVNAADFPAGDVTDLFNAALRTATLDAMQSDRIVRVVGEFDCEYGIAWGAAVKQAAFPGLAPYTPAGVTLDLTEASFVQHDTTAWKPGVEPRRHDGTTAFHVIRATDCEIVGGTFEGSNLDGRDGVPVHEQWMGLQLSRCKNLTVTGSSFSHMWSDSLSILGTPTDPSDEIVIEDCTFHVAGRHSLNVNGARNIIVRNSVLEGAQHMVIDHEPGKNGYLDGLTVSGCSGTTGGHGFLQLRPTPSSTCNNVTITGHRLNRGHYRCLVPAGGKQRDGLTLTDLISDDPHPWPGSHYSGAMIRIGGVGAGWNNVTVARVNDLVSAKAGPLDISETSPDPLVEQNVWAA